jgi:parallel beta-helix repeat protein
VEDSIVHDNAGIGITVYNGDQTENVDGNIVRHNIVYGQGGQGIQTSNGTGVIVHGNICYDNLYGITIGDGSGDPVANTWDTEIYDNTVFDNTSWGIILKSTSVDSRLVNNVIYHNGSGQDISDYSLGGTCRATNLPYLQDECP